MLGMRSLCGLRAFSTSSRSLEALRIAYFGSDQFSISSLKKLAELSKSNPELVSSIDVIAKPPKLVGRGLKTVREVAVVDFAKELGLKIIRAESADDINALIPNNYNMAIAVSYGQLIPEKFLNAVTFSLNVHPSLLPKYSGSSPLQYAILNQDPTTGVTVQTLHPTKFDRGQIVNQTGPIPLSVNETYETLRDKLAIEGASLLKKVILQKTYENPRFVSMEKFSYATRIKPELSEIQWDKPASSIIAKYRALGRLYSYREYCKKDKQRKMRLGWRRVIFEEMDIGEDITEHEPGEFIFKDNKIAIQTGNGSINVGKLQLEYNKKQTAEEFANSVVKLTGDTGNIFSEKPEDAPKDDVLVPIDEFEESKNKGN